MLIKSIELKNIKSYKHGTIEFKEGVNGICGQNGNGKTTILESIGYALFDFQPYKPISGLLRHGENSGYIYLTFEGDDEIDYVIKRKIGKVNDYVIKTPVEEIKGAKDVKKWIASNLFQNIKSENELPNIFENAIGVPQGTFTTAFLETTATKKIIFDNILKVEEYKTAFTNLLPTINSVKKNIDSLEKEVIPLKAKTEKYDERKKESIELKKEIDEIKKQIQDINSNILLFNKKKEELTNKKLKFDDFNSQIKVQNIKLENLKEKLKKLEFDLSQSEFAKKTVDTLLPIKEKIETEKQKQAQLNKDRIERDKLKDEIKALEFEIKTLLDKKERSSLLENEINELENKKLELIPKLELAKKLDIEINSFQKELKEPFSDNISKFSNLKEKEEKVKSLKNEIDNLNQQISSLSQLKDKQNELEEKTKELNIRKASIDSLLKQIKSDMKRAEPKGMCPFMNGVKCASISDFSKYFNDEINSKNKELEEIKNEQKSVSESLESLNNPRKKYDESNALLKSKINDINSFNDIPIKITSCLEEIKKLNEKFNLNLKPEKNDILVVDKLIDEKKTNLKALNSPDIEYKNISQNIEKNKKELKNLENVSELIKQCNSKKDKLKNEFLKYEGLDEKLKFVQDSITQLEPEYNKYLQAIPLASKFDEYKKEVEKTKEIIKKEDEILNENIKNRDELSKVFDEKELENTLQALESLKNKNSALSESEKEKGKILKKLLNELSVMESDISKIKDKEKLIENEKKFLSFSEFIRDTIKNSSEDIIKEYIGEISNEANNIFCEIMGDYSYSLSWTSDYDINIQFGGEIVSFKQLSGGEQMSAALAVRLAILKILSNSELVFLDEPTQNMDEIRRGRLSQQIMNIKGFKQIFVISHDDTFNEKYDHIIKVEKRNGESGVLC